MEFHSTHTSGDSKFHIYPNGLIACTVHDWGSRTGIDHRAEVLSSMVYIKGGLFYTRTKSVLYWTSNAHTTLTVFKYFDTHQHSLF